MTNPGSVEAHSLAKRSATEWTRRSCFPAAAPAQAADAPVTAEPDLFDSDDFLVLPSIPQAVKDDPDLPF
jgi:hypothetical protein